MFLTMNLQERICQNCNQQFNIEPKDFKFYDKIQVPPPTWCPECRLQRRIVFFNERGLYKRVCSLCGVQTISVFSPDKPLEVYCQKCFWRGSWDALTYQRPYDFSKAFFEQFFELFQRVPQSSLDSNYYTLVNSEYCNFVADLKNCYLLFNSGDSEHCCYGTLVRLGKECFDMLCADSCERCYEGINLKKCTDVCFSLNCDQCYQVYFSKNLIGCSHCFGCINLRNKQYYIFNTPYSKDNYFKRMKEFDVGSWRSLIRMKEKILPFHLSCPYRYFQGRKNTNVSGDYIDNSRNVSKSYHVIQGEDSKYCQFLTWPITRDSYDVTMWGGNALQTYECMGVGGGENTIAFCVNFWSGNTHHAEYSFDCIRSSYVFGCVNLEYKQYCILNKQYTKSSFEELRRKIIDHMNTMPYIDKKGRVYKYGEFFPPELSPFAYNETIAQEYFPLTKEEALERGYAWKDREAHQRATTLKHSQLPDHIKDVPDSITNEITQCAHSSFLTSNLQSPTSNFSSPTSTCNEQCTTAFRIIPQELKFYRQMNTPLPRLCPNCRHYQRLKQRNPLKLWHRSCQCAGVTNDQRLTTNDIVYKNTIEHFHKQNPCPNEFETSYAPERLEIVYCESCYLAEVA